MRDKKDAYTQYARDAVAIWLAQCDAFRAEPNCPTRVLVRNEASEDMRLDFTPCAMQAQEATALPFFSGVSTFSALFRAYEQARSAAEFEEDQAEAMREVSHYAATFMQSLWQHAQSGINDAQARLIAQFVQNLDIYAAVRACESLCYSKPDLALLEIAAKHRWQLHFDHLAVRCGTSRNHDAERIVQLLTQQHGYTAAQMPEEIFYQFDDGWNAYPLYKILKNGQVIRLFIDQSDAAAPKQIIQHWNKVYGYTAHHLAIRATQMQQGGRKAIPLAQLIKALEQHGVVVMKPTGHYTQGLLLQVFTKPKRNESIPQELLDQFAALDPALSAAIGNAKLLELVSRHEVPADMAQAYFQLYGLPFDATDPLHSVPYYQYFLPAQAAHVIKTSVSL